MDNVTIGLSGRTQLLEIVVEELLALQLGTATVEHRNRLRERLIMCAQLACDAGENGGNECDERLASAVDELFSRAEQQALAAPCGIAVDGGDPPSDSLAFGLTLYLPLMFPPPTELERES